MKRKILRNIAILSAIFVVTFSIMLITNYFQVSRQTPLKTEILETLKELNESAGDNLKLQEQIRELDLMSRKAYFVSTDRLITGIYILAAMFSVLIVSLHLLYVKNKNIPAKQLDSVDDWLIKTSARKYIALSAGVLTVTVLIFAYFSYSHLVSDNSPDKQSEQLAESKNISQNGENETDSEFSQAETENSTEATETTDTVESVKTEANTTEEKVSENISDTVSKTETKIEENKPETSENKPNTAESTSVTAVTETQTTQSPEISKVTHNGFRGNNSNGISSAKQVPNKWNLSAGENIAWKTATPKHGFNSPVINGNKVFMSGADEQARELYCFELNSGKLLWTLAADKIPGSPASMPKTNDDTGLAASTVVTNGKQVCAIFATGDLICADIEGNRLWAKNLGLPTNHYGYASSLLAYGNSLIVQYDNSVSPRVIALDMASGKEIWSKTRNDKISWSSPIIAYIDKKPQLILLGTPCITSYNPNNGEQNWRVECMSGEVGASPCFSAGTVYGASEYADLVAVNAADGQTLWKVNDYLPEVSSPVATRDNVFLATSYGVVACYDAKTGELTKFHELSEEFYSSPIIVEGKIYLFANSGKMFIFNANSDFALISSFDTGEQTFTTPAFTDGKIVVRTEKSVYCAVNNSKPT